MSRPLFQLLHGDCLTLLRDTPAGTVDLIAADLPYGTTQNKWDSALPLDELWSHYWRVLKPTGAVVLTAAQPFTSALVMSQPKLFRHEWVWIKNRGGNFANTVREPMREHESVLVFSRGKWTYNKQMQPRTGGGLDRVQYGFSSEVDQNSDSYGAFASNRTPILPPERVPSSWQKFNCEVGYHPTQKPVALFRYLVRTYSNPGELVLDNTMGSGTTGVAALAEGRRFLGMEQDAKHFATAQERIAAALAAS